MKETRNGTAVIAAAALITACATSSENITAKYVSPAQYNSLNCQQIEAEMIRVGNQARSVAGVQDSKATGDAVATGIGALVFWPALFFLVGGDKERELAQLKGERQALERVAIQKECGFAENFEETERHNAEEA